MKITVAHLAPTPFAQEVALAFLEAGSLGNFCTTLASPPSGVTARIFKGRRTVDPLLAPHLRGFPAREIFRLLATKWNRDPIFGDRVFHWTRDGFERDVIRHGLDGSDAVYAYETQCLKIFETARARGLTCLLDLPSPEHDFVESLLAAERAKFLAMKTPFHAYAAKLREERTRQRLRETELADWIFANSRFTADSWIHAGVDAAKIIVLPLGAPTVSTSTGTTDTVFRYVFAGTLDVRKGGHYLLEAWRACHFGERAELHIYGSLRLPEKLMQGLPSNVILHGPRSRAEVLEAFHRANLLVFPTLCDGFGMVVMEAFSCGLPVLTTSRAGASEFVRSGENGWIVEAGNAAALASGMQDALACRESLPAMQEAARETAYERPWSVYRQELRAAVSQRIEKKS